MIGWFGKFLGMLLGYKLLGPLGILLGLWLGHKVDQYLYSMMHQRHGAVQRVFFNTCFRVMGYLAKADGRISEKEIEAARSIMQQMGLNEQQRLQAIELFNLGKAGSIDLTLELTQLRQACHQQQALLRMFLEIQLRAAYADGYISPQKQAILQQICQELGFVPFDFMNRGYHQREQSHSYRQAQTRSSLDEDYATLQIAKTVTNAELKKAYRKLMSQNHPDKLVSKGLPESMIKLATEKTQQIQLAYERICQARGL